MLTKVTFTGADNTTDIKALLDLSAEYPFVEWAILVSPTHEGGFRFPTRRWIDQFTNAVTQSVPEVKVSTHLCGRWVRELLIGALSIKELPSCYSISRRVQINTHGEVHASTLPMMQNLNELEGDERQIIFQWDGVNDHLAFAADCYGINVAALFDASGGAGQLPRDGWKKPCTAFVCGYAGGLGPDNVVEQVARINEVVNGQEYWIDMEGRVRTENEEFDLEKVRTVLELTKPLIFRTSW
jgi:hypothetical protein